MLWVDRVSEAIHVRNCVNEFIIQQLFTVSFLHSVYSRCCFIFSFSVWKIGGEGFCTIEGKDTLPRIKDLECKIWSNSSQAQQARPRGWSCAATWYDHNNIVMGSNFGDVALYRQDFQHARDE
jgi:hypothetical protein